MTKKVVSVVLTIAMVLSCVVAVSAAETEANEKRYAVIGVLMEAGTNAALPRIEETIRLSYYGNGDYKVIDKAELVEGQKVIIAGTWGPFYENLWVMLECNNGRAVSVLLTSGRTVTITIPISGTYELSISADSDVDGTLQYTW